MHAWTVTASSLNVEALGLGSSFLAMHRCGLCSRCEALSSSLAWDIPLNSRLPILFSTGVRPYCDAMGGLSVQTPALNPHVPPLKKCETTLEESMGTKRHGLPSILFAVVIEKQDPLSYMDFNVSDSANIIHFADGGWLHLQHGTIANYCPIFLWVWN